MPPPVQANDAIVEQDGVPAARDRHVVDGHLQVVVRAVLVDAEDLVVLVVGDGEVALNDGVRGPVPLDLDVGVDVEVARGRIGRVARARDGEEDGRAVGGGGEVDDAGRVRGSAGRGRVQLDDGLAQAAVGGGGRDAGLPVPRGAMSSLRFTVKVTALAIAGRARPRARSPRGTRASRSWTGGAQTRSSSWLSPDRPRSLSVSGSGRRRFSPRHSREAGVEGQKASISGACAGGVGRGLRVSASAPATRVGSGDHQGAEYTPSAHDCQ